MSTHTGEKTFHCDICGAKFSLYSSLKSHVSMHNGEKPFHCVFLEYTSQRTHVNTHWRETFSLCIPGIHITKDSCQYSLERNLFIVKSVVRNFPRTHI